MNLTSAATDLPLRLACVVSEPFAENTYIAHLAGRRDCLVVDPGFDPEAIFAYLDEHELTPAAILNTHGHADHIAGNLALKERWPACPIVIGAGDAAMLTDPQTNLSGPFGFDFVSPPADQTVSEGDVFAAAGLELTVKELPGHSPGHVVFLWKGGQPWRLFGGDVLFRGSVGRTDFPGGSFAQLARGIRSKLFRALPGETIVHPGHGPETTLAHEQRTNPFVGDAAAAEE